MSSPSPADQLAAARRRIDAIDADLVRLAAERLAAAADAGRAKAEMGQSLVDYQREREVLDQVRAQAARLGLEPAVAQDVVTRLILASTSRQETLRAAEGAGATGTAVVVGGAGRMGRWFVRFLQGAGRRTVVLDPASPAGNAGAAASQLADADLIVLAVPPSEAARLYDAWAADPPRGIVADLCSVKSPLLAAFRRFMAAGGRAVSFHPMFGPAATVLRGADVVVCSGGHPQAEAAVRKLFAATSARIVEVGLDDHDRLMADVLTLAHATAIAFAASLPPEPLAAQGTTSRRLRDVAASVVDESPQVYYEVQAGNPHSLDALQRLESSVARLRGLVASGDGAGFRAMLADGRRRLAAEPARAASAPGTASSAQPAPGPATGGRP